MGEVSGHQAKYGKAPDLSQFQLVFYAFLSDKPYLVQYLLSVVTLMVNVEKKAGGIPCTAH